MTTRYCFLLPSPEHDSSCTSHARSRYTLNLTCTTTAAYQSTGSAARCAPARPPQQEQEKNPSRSGVRGRKRRAKRDYRREADDRRGRTPAGGERRVAVAVVADVPSPARPRRYCVTRPTVSEANRSGSAPGKKKGWQGLKTNDHS
jgi:hypothetical protein